MSGSLDVDLAHPAWYALAAVLPLVDGLIPIVPAASLLLGLGVAAGSGDGRAWPLVILCTVSAWLGDCFAFWVGRRHGARVADRLVRGPKGRAVRMRSEELLERYGARLVAVARIVPIGPTPITLGAGIMRMSGPRFRAAAAAGAVLWSVYYMGLGLVGGEVFDDRPLVGFVLAFAIAGAVSVIAVGLRRGIDRLRKRSGVRRADSSAAGHAEPRDRADGLDDLDGLEGIPGH